MCNSVQFRPVSIATTGVETDSGNLVNRNNKARKAGSSSFSRDGRGAHKVICIGDQRENIKEIWTSGPSNTSTQEISSARLTIVSPSIHQHIYYTYRASHIHTYAYIYIHIYIHNILHGKIYLTRIFLLFPSPRE